jgi:hypothetical protein
VRTAFWSRGEPGLLEIPHLGQLFEQLRQQPEQEARVGPRLQNELVGREDADDPAAVDG